MNRMNAKFWARGIAFTLLVYIGGSVSANEAEISYEVVQWDGFLTDGTTWNEDQLLKTPYNDKYGAKVGVILRSTCDNYFEFPIDLSLYDDCVSQCTAFLVSSRHIITYDNCVSGTDPANIMFVPAASDSLEPLAENILSLNAEKPYGISQPLKVRLFSDSNIALLTLDRSVGNIVGFFELAETFNEAEALHMFGYPKSRGCRDLFADGDDQWYHFVEIDTVDTTTFSSNVLACGGEAGAPAVTADGKVAGFLFQGSVTGGCGTCGFPNSFQRFPAEVIVLVSDAICEDSCTCAALPDETCIELSTLPDVWEADHFDDARYPHILFYEGDEGEQLHLGGEGVAQFTLLNVGGGVTEGVYFELFFSLLPDVLGVASAATDQLTSVGNYTISTSMLPGDRMVVTARLTVPLNFIDGQIMNLFVMYQSLSAEVERPAVLHWNHLHRFAVKGGPGIDQCPSNIEKWYIGECGCNALDIDSDDDGVLDCFDECPFNPDMTLIGVCGCQLGEDCPNPDWCPRDGLKTAPGVCGCGNPDIDSDGDGVLDCLDECPLNPDKVLEGNCLCDKPETDCELPEEQDADIQIESGRCFPADAVVQVKGKGDVRMEDIEIGDEVLDGSGDFSTVFFFGHRDPDSVKQFVRLVVGTGEALELSATHYAISEGQLVAASDFQIGDAIQLANGTSSPIVAKTVVRRRGLYNPHTTSSTIAVNGFQASTFTTALPVPLAKLLLAPVRVLYRTPIFRTYFERILDYGTPQLQTFIKFFSVEK